MKKRFCFMVLAVSLLLSGWCIAASAENGLTVEAENGTLLGGAVVKQSPSMSWVEGLQKTGDGVSVSITVPESGFYDIVVRSATTGGHKENDVEVNGQSVGNIVNESAFFEDQRVEYVYLDAGEHEIAVKHF